MGGEGFLEELEVHGVERGDRERRCGRVRAVGARSPARVWEHAPVHGGSPLGPRPNICRPGCGRSAAVCATRDARRATSTPALACVASHPRIDHPRSGIYCDEDPMRLAKHLAHAGVASRRAAETMIAPGECASTGSSCAIPPATWTSATASRSTAGPSPAPSRRSSTRCTSPSACSPPRATPTAGRPSSSSPRSPAASTPSGASTPTAAG